MIPGVVWITSKTLYGYTSRNVPIYMFVPFDKKYSQMLVGCSERDKSINIIALVQQINEVKPFPRGYITSILGKCGDKDAEYKALLHRYSPFAWSKKDHYNIKIPYDLTRYILDVPTINIDPPGCEDIDDCISIWKDDGPWKIAITIADVSVWIEENPWLVEKASKISQTFYKNGSVVNPMLPSELSQGLCSLKPLHERYGYSLFFDWDGNTLSNFVFCPVVIINKESHTYESVHNANYFPVDILKSVCSYLVGYETDDSHLWVEQLMILYNTRAALRLVETNTGILRVHTEPDMDKMTKYYSFENEIKTLAYSSAKYAYPDTKLQHWGLGGVNYCHVTSPIRRWCDVINQFALKGINFWGIIDKLNEVSSNAKKYERDCFFLDALLNDEKENIEAVVIDVLETKIKVWVRNWKRIISIKSQIDVKEGDIVLLSYYLDMNATTWKKRMVFRVEGINYPGQHSHEQSDFDNLAMSLKSQCLE